jgi:hypothetical protein
MPGQGKTIFGLTTPGVTLRSRSRPQIDEPYPPIWSTRCDGLIASGAVPDLDVLGV